MKRQTHVQRFISLILLFALLILIIPLSIGSSSTNAAPDEPTADNDIFLPMVRNALPPIIPETTEVLTDDTTQHLVSVSQDGATFTFSQMTPELAALDDGDVMVSDVSDAAPYGFLREVADVTMIGGEVVVTTEAATLEDAIQQGEFSYSKRLTPADIEGMTAQPGMQLMRSAAANIDDSFFFEINDVALYDEDGNLGTTYDQLKVNGSLELAPDFSFDWRIEDWTLQELEFIFNVEEITELEFQAEVDLLSAELLRHELAQLQLGTITVFVGPVPVVFVIEMPIYLRADGEVSVGVTTSVMQEANLSAGLRYEQGNWSPISSLNNDFGWEPPTLSAGVDLKGYIDPPLSLLLYGVTGPFAGVNPYLKLEADIFADPWWELFAGIEATVGLKVEVLGHSLGEHTEVVVGYEILLAQAATSQPPNTPSNPLPPDEAIDQSINADLGWTGGDSDGDSVTYDVYLEADDITPDMLVSDDQSGTTFDPGTLAANTHYYWQIVAEDEQGEVTEGPIWDFTTGAMINEPPHLPAYPTPGDGAFDQSITIDLAWGGGDPDGDAVTYDVYFEANDATPDVIVATDQSATSFDPGALVENTQYYWQVVAEDEHGEVTAGPIWDFTTAWAANNDPTARVSVDSNGTQGNGGSNYSVISANGRYVAFQSSASNLVSEDTNGDPDIFVHDIQTGETIRVSVDSNGTQVSAGASYPVISAEGRYVAFESLDSNLVSEDTNGDRDIFLHDTVTEATTRVSVTSNGIQANAESWYPAISADGRYVAFESWASNLVNGDTNGYRDIFLHDTQTGATIRVSIASDGTQADGGSMYPVISADGRYVAFRSYASNLVSGDTNGNPDIFLHDTQTGETVRISVDSNGTEANGNQVSPAISADGRYVAFDSDASNLVNDDTNGVNDIFLHDTENGETIRVSVGSNGMQGNDHSWKRPAVSADGRFVVFESDANNLVSGDTNGGSDIFLHNTETGETIRVSVDIEGTQGNGLSGYPTISADGRYVAFYSDASNLVSEDTNGARDVFLRDTQVGHAALWLSQPQLHSQAD